MRGEEQSWRSKVDGLEGVGEKRRKASSLVEQHPRIIRRRGAPAPQRLKVCVLSARSESSSHCSQAEATVPPVLEQGHSGCKPLESPAVRPCSPALLGRTPALRETPPACKIVQCSATGSVLPSGASVEGVDGCRAGWVMRLAAGRGSDRRASEGAR